MKTIKITSDKEMNSKLNEMLSKYEIEYTIQAIELISMLYPSKVSKVVEQYLFKGYSNSEEIIPIWNDDFDGKYYSTRVDLSNILVDLIEQYPKLKVWKKVSQVNFYGVDRLPTNINVLSNLDTLWCDSIGLQDQITEVPSSIGKLKKLRWLRLSGHQDLKTLPSSIKNTKLNRLGIYHCDEFTLPKSIENLPLFDIDLHDIENLIIKTDFSQINTLRDLAMNYCNLTTLPRTFDIPSLRRLYLSGNHFKSVPKQIFNSQDLKELFIGIDSRYSLPRSTTIRKKLPELIRLDVSKVRVR